MKPRLELLEPRDCPSTLDLSGFALTNVAVLSSDGTGYTVETSGGDANTYSGITAITGNRGGLTGESVTSVFTVSAVNAGSYDDGQGNGPLTFTATTSLVSQATSTFSFVSAYSSIAGHLTGSGNDKLDYTGARTTGIQVNLTTGQASGTGGISGIQNVTGTSGNDLIIGNSLPSVFDGGTGGNDLIIGRGGNTTITTHGSGHNLLIGGSGSNTLVAGSSGGDLMIGESTVWDTNLTALQAIEAEWTRVGETYTVRVAHLQGTLGGGLNGNYKLNGSTVVHSTNHSTVDGSGNVGMDWYIVAFAADAVMKAGEVKAVI